VALAALTLVGLWVGVYWLWPAGDAASKGDAPITFDDHPPVDPRSLGLPGPEAARPEEPSEQPTERAGASEPAARADAGAGPLDGLEAAPGPDLAPAEAPRFESYTIRPGDNFPRIAERVYGDSSWWSAIAKANPLTDPTKLRPGQTIRVPLDPENVQGGPAVAGSDPPAVRSGAPTEHVVAPGETLGEIAAALYGRSSLWPLIFDANRERLELSAPENLRPGMRLVIPPPPDLAAATDEGDGA